MFFKTCVSILYQLILVSKPAMLQDANTEQLLIPKGEKLTNLTIDFCANETVYFINSIALSVSPNPTLFKPDQKVTITGEVNLAREIEKGSKISFLISKKSTPDTTFPCLDVSVFIKCSKFLEIFILLNILLLLLSFVCFISITNNYKKYRFINDELKCV